MCWYKKECWIYPVYYLVLMVYEEYKIIVHKIFKWISSRACLLIFLSSSWNIKTIYSEVFFLKIDWSIK